MPLLGWPLLVTLGLATGLATVLVVVLWSRVRGPAPARLAQRLALVLVGQVAAVLLVAAAAERLRVLLRFVVRAVRHLDG